MADDSDVVVPYASAGAGALDDQIAQVERDLGGKAACERYLRLLERAGQIDRTRGSFLTALIKKYIRIVVDCEGVDFLVDPFRPSDTSSDPEMALLQTLSREVFHEDSLEWRASQAQQDQEATDG